MSEKSELNSSRIEDDVAMQTIAGLLFDAGQNGPDTPPPFEMVGSDGTVKPQFREFADTLGVAGSYEMQTPVSAKSESYPSLDVITMEDSSVQLLRRFSRDGNSDNSTAEMDLDKKGDPKSRFLATIQTLIPSKTNNTGAPFDIEKEPVGVPYQLPQQGVVNGLRAVDRGVEKTARAILRTPDGDDSLQWVLATPYRWRELLENRDWRGLSRRAIATSAITAMAIQGAGLFFGPDLVREAAEEPSFVFYRDESGVTAPFDTENQDPIISSRAAELVMGLPEGTVTVDTAKQELRINTPEIDDKQVVVGIIAAQAPEAEMLTENHVEQEQAYPEEIMRLVKDIDVSPQTYESFDVDTTYEDVFKEQMSGERIKPTKFVAHWTAGTYENGVEDFINVMKKREGNCCSVMYFIDQSGKTYRFSDSWEKTAHAYGANSFTQGVEIEAKGQDDLNTDQMNSLLMLAKRFMDANDIPITRENFVGHLEIDAEHGRGQKPDMPPELMDALFEKLDQFNHQFTDTNNVDTLDGMNAQERFNHYTNQLLEEIAAHEAEKGHEWDSVNTGKAGDTKFGSDKYKDLFSGRNLSDVSVQEILDLQAAGRLKAVGRYQFMPDTLLEAVKATGIDTSHSFSSENQNQLAVDYLLLGGKRKTLTSYLTGQSDDLEGAIKDACKEWSSLPCIDGTGYYDGDSAGNMAAGGKQRVEKIKSILSDMRQAYIEAHSEPLPPVVESNPPSLPKMVISGDSLAVGLRDYGNIQNVDESYGMEVTAINARTGRALAGGGDDGLESLSELSAEIKDADFVYLGYGTNVVESNDIFKESLEQAIHNIQAQSSGAKIVIPLIYSDIEAKNTRNEIIKTIAQKANGVYVIDVSGSVELAGDGVHPKNYKALTEAIMGQISTITEESQSTQHKQVEAQPTESTSTTIKLSTSTAAQQEQKKYTGAWISREAATNAYRPFFSHPDMTVDEIGLEEWVNNLEVNEEGKVFVTPDQLPGEK